MGPVETLNSSGTVVSDLEYGANGYLGDRESSTTGALYTYDPLGNGVQPTDYSAGIKSTSLPMGAFGTLSGTYVPTANYGRQHNFNYSYNSANGLEGLGARLYDPRSGRFINRDPISYAGGINVYEYAGDNPVNGMDPWGMDPGTATWGGINWGNVGAGLTSLGGGIAAGGRWLIAGASDVGAAIVSVPALVVGGVFGLQTPTASDDTMYNYHPAAMAEIYRGGRMNPGNWKHSPGGRSARSSLSNPWPLEPGQRPVFPLGGEWVGLNTDLLPPGSVTWDNNPPGHCSIDNDLSMEDLNDANGRDPKDLKNKPGTKGKFPE